MKSIAVIINIFMFLKTIAYAIFEMKQKNNKSGGVAIIIVCTITFILFNILLYIR